MNFSVIRYVIGIVLKIEGLLFILPCIVGLIYGEKEFLSFLICSVATVALGYAVSAKKPKNQVFYAREGFVTVAASWIVLSLCGCIPFILNGDIPHFADAFFETVSGFSTTGSSILSDVESLSKCSLFWRSFSHWIGGMGVLVFILSVVPMTGGAAMHLMKAESPGPNVGKIVPKLRNTSMLLYVIYSVLTVVEIIVLLIGGMPPFDAVTVALGTAGTGGFAIKNSSIADYSVFCQYAVGVFMVLFGVNFNAYYLILSKRFKQALKCEEVRWYFTIIAVSVLLITINTRHMFSGLEECFRNAFFQVDSIITTTGYSTTDFDLYPHFSKSILLLLMFIGACAGSTGGGMKVSRIIILFKSVRDELSRIVHPKTVKRIRLEKKVVEHETLRSVNTFLVAYVLIYVVSILIISIDDFDFITNFTSVAATINNIGPGLAKVGPSCNFSEFSDLSKYVFCFDMLAGRLELFPMLVLFSPQAWGNTIKVKIRKRKSNKIL